MKRSLCVFLIAFAVLIGNVGSAQEIHLHNTIPSTANPRNLVLRPSGTSADGTGKFAVLTGGYQSEFYRLGYCQNAVIGKTQHLRVTFSPTKPQTVSYKIQSQLMPQPYHDIAARGCTDGKRATFDIYRKFDYHKSCDAVYIEVRNLANGITVEIEERNGISQSPPYTFPGWQNGCKDFGDGWSAVGTLK